MTVVGSFNCRLLLGVSESESPAIPNGIKAAAINKATATAKTVCLSMIIVLQIPLVGGICQ